jgi:hypothetical protein
MLATMIPRLLHQLWRREAPRGALAPSRARGIFDKSSNELRKESICRFVDEMMVDKVDLDTPLANGQANFTILFYVSLLFHMFVPLNIPFFRRVVDLSATRIPPSLF